MSVRHIYIVVAGSYEGDYVVGVWDRKRPAVKVARASARTWDEVFGGGIGHGTSVRRHAMNTEDPGEALDGWQDWKAKIEGNRLVLDEA